MKNLCGWFWGDFADRFAHHFSPAFFLLLAIFLGSNQHLGNPIRCWTPAQLNESQCSYATSYCQSQNTYFLPLSEYVPMKYSEREQKKIDYNQWTPVLLLLMAPAFIIPGICWKTLAGITTIPFPLLMEAANDGRHLNGESREKAFQKLSGRIGIDLSRFHPGRIFGILLYLTLKLFYPILWWNQINVISSHFGTDHHYPVRVLTDVQEGREWEMLDNFPVISLCDFEIRSMGNIHRYSIQCLNSIQALMPVLVVLIYCWLFIGLVLALASLAVWIATAVVALIGPCRCLLLGPLVMAAEGGSIAKSDLRQFLSELPSDSVFLLRLIQTRVGDLQAQEIVSELWSRFRGEGQPKWRMMTDD